MTRPKAISKVRKLLALANDKAATDAEADLAKLKAEELIERFELSDAETAPEPVRRPRPPRPPRPPQPVPVYGYATTTNATSATFIFYAQ